MSETKKSEVNWSAVLMEALASANAATQELIDANPGVWYPCGFAWVNIKPARGKLVEMLKAKCIGYTDSYYGGYSISNPSHNATQWMDAKIAGAYAFAAVLKKHGINCTVNQRID